MSLVNDMLRDLDQRRQDTNSSGVGAERLVPVATELEKKKSKFSLFAFAMSIAITLSLIMAFLYFRQASLVTPTPVEPVFAPAPVAVPAQEAASAAPVQVVGVDPDEHALVTARLQALEEENRALLEAQQAALQAQERKFAQELAALESAQTELVPAAPAEAANSNALSQASAALDELDALALESSTQAAAQEATVQETPEESCSL